MLRCFGGKTQAEARGDPCVLLYPSPPAPRPPCPPCPFPCLSHLPRSLAARSRHGSRSQGRPCPARPEEAARHRRFLVSLSGWAAGERAGGCRACMGLWVPLGQNKDPRSPPVCYTPSGSGCSGLLPWALGFLCQLRKLTQCIPKPLLAGATNSPIVTEAGPLLRPGEAWIPPGEGP